MVRSMTGFASAEIQVKSVPHWVAALELKSVNARGLDIRIRMPDWISGLEAEVKKVLSGKVARGSIAVSVRLNRLEDHTEGSASDAVSDLLSELKRIEALAAQVGVSLAAPSALDILNHRVGAPDQTVPSTTLVPLKTELLDHIALLLPAFDASRTGEGQALCTLISGHVDAIDGMIAQARATLPQRQERAKSKLRDALLKLMDETDIDETRLTQELAVVAMKGDVTEELDRLTAHCAAARDLLNQDGPIGRKLDFLCQEFNREANTLCAKSGDADLTRVGLALKTVIEQMREQVQNVE